MWKETAVISHNILF